MIKWKNSTISTFPKMSVNTFNTQDVDAISAIEQSAGIYPWSKKNLLSSLKQNHLCIGVIKHNQWVAHAVFSHILDEMECLILSVAGAYQRQGLASMLLQSVIKQAKESKMSVIHLEVRASNTAAFTLYKRLGFFESGCRKNYYPITGEISKKEDAILLSLQLT